jgi:hypothetical protein
MEGESLRLISMGFAGWLQEIKRIIDQQIYTLKAPYIVRQFHLALGGTRTREAVFAKADARSDDQE